MVHYPAGALGIAKPGSKTHFVQLFRVGFPRKRHRASSNKHLSDLRQTNVSPLQNRGLLYPQQPLRRLKNRTTKNRKQRILNKNPLPAYAPKRQQGHRSQRRRLQLPGTLESLQGGLRTRLGE